MQRWLRIGLSVVVLMAAGPVLPALAFPGASAGASWRVLYRPTAPTGYLTSVVATSSTGAWAGGTVTGSTCGTRNWLLVHRVGRTWKRGSRPEVEAPGRA